jgi:homoserine kinase type II
MASEETARGAALNEVALREALSAWALPPEASLERVRGGATHRVYRVVAGGGSFFLRVYATAEARVAAREHALIRYVAARGVPAALPVATEDGTTAVERAGLLLALYEPARGRQLEPTSLGASEAVHAGRALAELHAATASLPNDELADDDHLRWELRWDGPAWVERLQRVEQAITGLHSPTADDDWALRRTREQRAWLANPACAHQYAPRYSAQVTHGDYQHANLFFESGRVSGVIDWDQSARMPRAYEAVRACSFMFSLDPQRTRAFLQAYTDTSGAGPAEIEDGALAWGVWHDHHVWPLEQVYLHGNEAARRFIPRAPFRPFELRWQSIGDEPMSVRF